MAEGHKEDTGRVLLLLLDENISHCLFSVFKVTNVLYQSRAFGESYNDICYATVCTVIQEKPMMSTGGQQKNSSIQQHNFWTNNTQGQC